jgi:hypothetical protein
MDGLGGLKEINGYGTEGIKASPATGLLTEGNLVWGNFLTQLLAKIPKAFWSGGLPIMILNWLQAT